MSLLIVLRKKSTRSNMHRPNSHGGTGPPAMETNQFYSTWQFARPAHLVLFQKQLLRKTGSMEHEEHSSWLPCWHCSPEAVRVGVSCSLWTQLIFCEELIDGTGRVAIPGVAQGQQDYMESSLQMSDRVSRTWGYADTYVHLQSWLPVAYLVEHVQLHDYFQCPMSRRMEISQW